MTNNHCRSSVLVAKQHSSFHYQKTDQQGSNTSHTRTTEWHSTLLHKPDLVSIENAYSSVFLQWGYWRYYITLYDIICGDLSLLIKDDYWFRMTWRGVVVPSHRFSTQREEEACLPGWDCSCLLWRWVLLSAIFCHFTVMRVCNSWLDRQLVFYSSLFWFIDTFHHDCWSKPNQNVCNLHRFYQTQPCVTTTCGLDCSVLISLVRFSLDWITLVWISLDHDIMCFYRKWV